MLNEPGKFTLEVCVASVQDAQEAAAGGADRLELNSALELGGLTPSVGLLAEVKRSVSIPVVVMLRPRAAGFCYNPDELRTMRSDAEQLLGLGADGLVFGILNPQMRVNLDACRQLVELAGKRETVFHRALDVVPDMQLGMEHVMELGVTRLLTSGQAATALAGANRIAQLQRSCGDRVEILPAAGIGPENVRQLLQRTRCRQVHGSFSRPLCDEAGVVADSAYRCTDPQIVRAMKLRLEGLSSEM